MKITIVKDLNVKAGVYDTQDGNDGVEVSVDFWLPGDEPPTPPVDPPPDPGEPDPPPDPTEPPDPPPVDPPAEPAAWPPPVAAPTLAGPTVIVAATFADGTIGSVTLLPGQRINLGPSIEYGSAVLHADGLSVCIEHCYMGAKTVLNGHFTITVQGGALLFDGDLRFGARKRTRPFWVQAPVAKAAPDWQWFPNYAGGAQSSMYAAYMKADNGPLGRGLASHGFNGTGEREDLSGPLWDVAMITNPTPENAVVVRGMSDAASVWAVHVIDPATNDMLDMGQNPTAGLWSVDDDGAGLILMQAQAHATNFSLVAAELYGTDYDAEEVGFWCNYYQSLWQSPSYRQTNGCVTFATQVRGAARGLDYLLRASKYARPKWRPLYVNWINGLLADGVARWVGKSGIQVAPKPSSPPKGLYAPWEQQILIGALGHAIDYGYADAQTILDYFAPPIFDSVLGDGQKPDICHEFASGYRRSFQRTPGGERVADWREACNVDAANSATFAVTLNAAEDSQARMDAMYPGATNYKAGDFKGYPWSPTGYPACLHVAVTALANHATDQTKAQACYAKFMQFYRADHSRDAKYNEVPKT